MEEIKQASIMALLSGIIVGVLFGFVLQRGRYRINSAFTETPLPVCVPKDPRIKGEIIKTIVVTDQTSQQLRDSS